MKEKNMNKGWNYGIEGNYDLTSGSLNYVLFNVLFDDKIISTRILDDFPSTEQCINMMCDTKDAFIESITK